MNLPAKLVLVLKTLFVMSVAILFVAVFNLYSDPFSSASKISSATLPATPRPTEISAGSDIDSCGLECRRYIAEEISKAMATVSGTVETKTVVEKVTTSPSASTSYISMGGTATTKATDWVTLDDTAVYIDPESDYGKDAIFTWDASLKVAHSNGQAFARIYDETNGIAVSGSELTTTNNSNFEQKISGALPLWRGRNLYKVQLKSLNSFEVTYSSGRIKVSY